MSSNGYERHEPNYPTTEELAILGAVTTVRIEQAHTQNLLYEGVDFGKWKFEVDVSDENTRVEFEDLLPKVGAHWDRRKETDRTKSLIVRTHRLQADEQRELIDFFSLLFLKGTNFVAAVNRATVYVSDFNTGNQWEDSHRLLYCVDEMLELSLCDAGEVRRLTKILALAEPYAVINYN